MHDEDTNATVIMRESVVQISFALDIEAVKRFCFNCAYLPRLDYLLIYNCQMGMKDNWCTIHLVKWLLRNCKQSRARPKIRWRDELRKFRDKEWTLEADCRRG